MANKKKLRPIPVSSDVVALLFLVKALGQALGLPAISGPQAAENLKKMREEAERAIKSKTPYKSPLL